MDIQVTCKAADTLPIDRLMDFQGDMKKISKENLEKLKRRIIKHGINAPVFVWDHEGDYYILDGHQRIKALHSLREDGYNMPMIPVAYIEAESERDAKDKLLGITSQFGDFDVEGVLKFTDEIDIEWGDLSLSDNGKLYLHDPEDIDDLFTDDPDTGDEEEKEICPHCGQVMP